jgi:hypothetical protein
VWRGKSDRERDHLGDGWGQVRPTLGFTDEEVGLAQALVGGGGGVRLDAALSLVVEGEKRECVCCQRQVDAQEARGERLRPANARTALATD